MGATLSSRKDFNRVLAQQPRTSIHIPRYDLLQPIRSENSTGSLPMPFPELTSKPQIQREYESAIFSDAISVVSDHTAQSDSSYIIFDQMQQKQVNEFQPDVPMYDKLRSNDTVILSRSLMHEKDQQQMKNYCSTSIRPEHTMVERNGKKFIVKVKHRTERRYVEYNDPNTHKKRLFEVIDCIPYRIIEPYNEHSKSNNRSLQSTVRSSHSPIILALAENRSETSSPSTSDHNVNPQDCNRLFQTDSHRIQKTNKTNNNYERTTDISTEIMGKYELSRSSHSFTVSRDSPVNHQPINTNKYERKPVITHTHPTENKDYLDKQFNSVNYISIPVTTKQQSQSMMNKSVSYI